MKYTGKCQQMIVDSLCSVYYVPHRNHWSLSRY